MALRRALLLVCTAVLMTALVPSPSVASTDLEGTADATLVLFWGDGCPHCEAEIDFLSRLATEHPDLEIVAYEVWKDAGNRQIFIDTLGALGEEPSGVPTTLFDGRMWVGFSDSVASEIRAAVEAEMLGTDDPSPGGAVVDVPVFGETISGRRPSSPAPC